MHKVRKIAMWLLYGLAAACLVGFVISVISDATQYDSQVDSAPFTAFVFVRVIECVVPAIILGFAGLVTSGRFKTFFSK